MINESIEREKWASSPHIFSNKWTDLNLYGMLCPGFKHVTVYVLISLRTVMFLLSITISWEPYSWSTFKWCCVRVDWRIIFTQSIPSCRHCHNRMHRQNCNQIRVKSVCVCLVWFFSGSACSCDAKYCCSELFCASLCVLCVCLSENNDHRRKKKRKHKCHLKNESCDFFLKH